jgi:hypothetical protein
VKAGEKVREMFAIKRRGAKSWGDGRTHFLSGRRLLESGMPTRKGRGKAGQIFEEGLKVLWSGGRGNEKASGPQKLQAQNFG